MDAIRTAVALLALVQLGQGYYLPGTYPQEFRYGERLQAEANSLTSSETELPFDYYSMPYCKPDVGVQKVVSSVNPGTILMGLRIENSPYHFYMMVDEKGKNACSAEGEKNGYGPLTKDEFNNLAEKIHEHYRARLILDNLPVTTYDLEQDPDSVRPGFEVGFESEGKFYINNHLKFRILVHPTDGRYAAMREDMEQLEAAAVVESTGRKLLSKEQVQQLVDSVGRRLEEAESVAEAEAEAEAQLEEEMELLEALDDDWFGPSHMYMVVGFEVVACSIKRTPGEAIENLPCPDELNDVQPQEVNEGTSIVYTYDVEWEESDITWVSRWDAYLKMPGGKVHWFSILNSIMVVLVMACIVAMILLRTIRRDLARYEQMLTDAGSNADVEESGWKMVSGDVFRAPRNPVALCVHVGTGMQILVASGITLLFAAMGFLSPASRGALLTALLVLYMLLAVAAGWSATWLWGMISRSYDGWTKVVLRTALFFPGVCLAILCVVNVLIRHTGSTGAVPFLVFCIMLVIWFAMTIPLCFSGGLLATKQEVREYPTRTNQIPRHIPPPHLASNPIVLFFAAGLLPFGTMFVELYFAMNSIWQGYFYYIFGFLFVVGILTTVVTIEVGIVCTYVQLCAEDYLWWWRSFHRGGSVALYLMLYSFGFLFNTLSDISGLLSVIIYLVYMALLGWGVYLAMGTVGFMSSFFFAYRIFQSVKAD